MKSATKQAGQVYFEKPDYQKIKMMAQREGVSFAEFVRRGTLEYTKKIERKKSSQKKNKKMERHTAHISGNKGKSKSFRRN